MERSPGRSDGAYSKTTALASPVVRPILIRCPDIQASFVPSSLLETSQVGASTAEEASQNFPERHDHFYL